IFDLFSDYDKQVEKMVEEQTKMTEKMFEEQRENSKKQLADMYFKMAESTKDSDLQMAARYYENAAVNGLLQAQYEIGECYAFGKGVPQDYKIAALWFEKAAENGNADAQYALGICHELGYGVEKSSQYMKWYTRAALQGHEKAKEALKRLTGA
ncbi:MAG: sel1 repeat family protein, partial [Muribaculaceae bacterium]|nr:sel1 repeat family protein [Muribaculaceae bacterium]